MYPSFEPTARPVARAKAKKGSSKRQTSQLYPPLQPDPPSEDGFPSGFEGDFRFGEAEEEGLGKQNIEDSPDAISYPSPTIYPSYVQQPPVGSPPQLRLDRRTERYDIYGPGQISSISPPQIYSRPQAVTQSPVGSPPSRIASLQSPKSQQSRLHVDPHTQNSRFPYHPPPNSNSTRHPTFDSHENRENQSESRPHFRSFDTLQASGDAASSALENVILSGYDGHLDVNTIDPKHTKLIGRINFEGDAVLGGKIIPCTSRQDSFRELRPMVAVILHGQPYTSDRNPGHASGQNRSPVMNQVGRSHTDENLFQTRVEVRSLKDGSHITTLYKSSVVAMSTISRPSRNVYQPRSADLTIDTQNSFIVVASNISGEVFIFAPVTKQDRSQERFKCIGKYWTSIRKRSQTNNADIHPTTPEDDSQTTNQAPILSLSQRWLAFAPPASPSRHSVQGTVTVSPQDSRPPGVESVTAPAPPTSNCTLDIPDPESLTNKMAKGIAKEVVRGAQWVGAQGWQAWQSYWNKPPQLGVNTDTAGERAVNLHFPPTHADHHKKGSEDLDPGDQVSIIDLEQILGLGSSKIRKKQEPIATFTVPAGCSFVSFAPNGLFLLTVSQNGDTQHVWDLLGLRARKSQTKPGSRTAQSEPCLREIARFSRFTNASVVDVAWSSPRCDKLAMVTEKGTVHVFTLPPSAFMWPPPRRRGSRETLTETAQAQDSASEVKQEDTRLPIGQPGPLSSAALKVSDTTRPIVETVRKRSNSSVTMLTNNLGEFTFSTAASLQRGKALAAGVSKSFGAAAGQINQIRRASESRFHIKRAQSAGGVSAGSVQVGCVRFLTGIERGFIGAVYDDTLFFHCFRRSGDSLATNKDSELLLLSADVGPSDEQSNQQPSPLSFFRPNTSAEALGSIAVSTANLNTSTHPLAYAEIETNAPFQPFYTNNRVTLSTYKGSKPWDLDGDGNSVWAVPASNFPSRAKVSSGSSSASAAPWAFGTAIPADAVDLSAEHRKQDAESAVLDLPLVEEDQDDDGGAAHWGLDTMGREEALIADDVLLDIDEPPKVEEMPIEDDDIWTKSSKIKKEKKIGKKTKKSLTPQSPWEDYT